MTEIQDFLFFIFLIQATFVCRDHGGLKMLLQYLIKFTRAYCPIHEFFSHAKGLLMYKTEH